MGAPPGAYPRVRGGVQPDVYQAVRSRLDRDMHRAARRAGWLVAAALLLAVGWLALGAWQAHRDLTSARDRIPSLRAAVEAGDTAAVRALVGRLQAETASARSSTHGPLWAAAAAAPWAGDTARALQGVTATVDDVARVLPSLVDAMQALDPARLMPEGDRLELSALSEAEPLLAEADAALTALDARGPGRGRVLPALARAQSDLQDDVDLLRKVVGTALRASRLLPPVLGADGPRRYFVGFQTNAESRGTGGLVGAHGLLVADRGRLSMPVLGKDTDLSETRSVTDLGADYRALYGRDTELWSNTNLSPHFPYAARRWIDVWEEHTGQRLDGALATDPVALAHLLGVHGDVALPDGERITADGVVHLTEWEAYSRFDGRDEARKQFLVDIARAVVGELLDGSVDLRELATGMRDVVADRRLVAYSTHPDEQRALEDASLAGTVPVDAAPYAAVVVNNAAGNKLDYHLRREVVYELGPCTAGTRETVLRVRLTNDVPEGPLADYASGRGDLPDGAPFRRGSNKLHVAVYATSGATLQTASLDGVGKAVHSGQERGRPVFVLPVELQRGQSRVLTLRLTEPAREGSVRVPVQPLVLPQVTTVVDRGCPAAQRRVSTSAALTS
ncbi:MAG: hypothetical protein JWN08_432 [Frankiales bacterium]|nr:hypothetical protein [Frankiales bacterium]